MLKYYNLIKQLSDRDKIRMLCDIESLGDEKYASLGIPAIRVGEIEKYLSGDFPTSVALANSWDTELVGKIADAAVRKMKQDSVNLTVMPSPKIKINPFSPTLSEDPYLATVMAEEYFKAAQRASVSSCLNDFRLTSRESDWMDRVPDERFVYEYIVKPYAEIAKKGNCVSVLTDSSHIAENYRAINQTLTDLVGKGRIADGAVPMSRKLPAEHTASHFARGGLAFEASSVVLEGALDKYRQMKKEIDLGKVTAEELQSEILGGKAISEEMIDAAVDRLLDFAYTVSKKTTDDWDTDTVNDSLREKAVGESIVLLKNQSDILPLKKNSRVVVIGDLAQTEYPIAEAFGNELENLGYYYVGYARGYDLAQERSDTLLGEAQMQASKADIAIVFLGFGKERERRLHKLEKLSIPANQQELLDRLAANHTKIIAVLPSEFCPDVVLEEACHAIMMAPLNTDCSAHVLARVVAGNVNPCGKLASTVYMDTDTLYKEHKTYRLRDGIRTGPFIGYRYYDTSDYYPGYPFGYGLSYTQFVYSQLEISSSAVTFTVKNVGKTRGVEIAQAYIGMTKSEVIRPRRELMGFARVDLAPGEKKTVTIPIRIPSVYVKHHDAWYSEKGEYTVFVGASVGEIRLSQSLEAGQHPLMSDGMTLDRYIQSESNIITDDYKLEARCDTMKKSVFNFIVGGGAMALAIGLKLFCVIAKIDAIFLDIVSALIAVGGIALFIYEGVVRNRIYRDLQERIDQKNEERFRDAEQLPVPDAEKMFATEFDGVDEIESAQKEIHTEVVDTEYLKHIDKEQDFMSAVKDFETYATDKGYYLETEAVKNIFASLASSRLLLTEGMDQESFHDLMLLLCGYFGTPIYVDETNETYASADSVLFGSDAYGARLRTNAFGALEAACNDVKKIHFSALDNVRAEDLTKYFTPYVNYVKNPLSQYHVTVLNDKNVESSYYIPPNIWFVLNLAQGETVDMIPDFVTEVATVNHIRIVKREPMQYEGVLRQFSYYQMEYLTDRISANYAVDEELWKRIDRLEAYVNGFTPYHIGNKLWLCMEKFALVHIACESEATEAVDGAVCAKLLPSMLANLKGKLPKEEKSFAETVEGIFGEGRADRCVRFIKTSNVELT